MSNLVPILAYFLTFYVCNQSLILYLKGGGHAKKVFLILVSNGQLNGEVMKYAFLKFFIP